MGHHSKEKERHRKSHKRHKRKTKRRSNKDSTADSVHSSDRSPVENLDENCLCADLLCKVEKNQLRDELSQLKSKYSTADLVFDPSQLHEYSNHPSKLLYEAWNTAGLERVIELIPEDILSYSSFKENESVVQALPKLLNTTNKPIPKGVRYIWSTCLKELSSRSQEEICQILNNSKSDFTVSNEEIL